MEEEKLTKAGRRPSVRSHSSRSMAKDVRSLWSTATMSQVHTNVSLADVCENFDDEGRDGQPHSRSQSLKGKFSFKAEEQEAPLGLEPRLDSGSLNEDSTKEGDKQSSESSISISKRTPHRAYWEEQQNRLPLPLMELMENEALEILTKALNSYKTSIGRSHFMTKELQRYIEGLRKRRNQRLLCIV